MGHKFIGCSEMMMIKVIEDLRQRVKQQSLRLLRWDYSKITKMIIKRYVAW